MNGLTRICSECGYNSSTYLDRLIKKKAELTNQVTPLDEVMEDLPGGALLFMLDSKENERLASDIRWRRVDHVCAILSQEETFEGLLIPEKIAAMRSSERRSVYTNDKYDWHWQQLTRVGIMEDVDIEGISFFSTYFSVPKSEETSRAIFNGKRLSDLFLAPPPVHLMDAPRLLRKIEEWHGKEKGEVYMLNGDLRHWFHQLALGKKNRKWFGLRMRKKDRGSRWCTLPMGWSWSPHIAQAIGYAFLAYREEGEEQLVDETGLDDPNLPYYLPMKNPEGEVCGFTCLYYDNYYVLTNNREVAERMKQRIELNSRRLHVIIKENSCSFYTPQDLREGEMEHLGIRLSTCPQTGVLRWRTNPMEAADLPEIRSPRQAAAVIGKCLYRHLVSLRPLSSSSEALDLIGVLRKIGSMARTLSWDTVFDARNGLDISDREVLESAWTSRIANEWFHSTIQGEKEPRVRLILTSDACDSGWGYVALDWDGKPVVISPRCGAVGAPMALPPYLRDSAERKVHIYFKEMHGMCEALLAAFEHARQREVLLDIHLMVDNVATLAGWRNGYSSTDLGNAELRRVFSHPDYERHHIHAYGIPGLLNVADVPSRMKGKAFHRMTKEYQRDLIKDFNKRVETTLRVAQGQAGGRNSEVNSKVHGDFRIANAKLRHPDPLPMCDEADSIDEYLL